jgi:hypothetical protein
MSGADTIRAAHDEAIKRAADQGKLLEVGFLALAVVAMKAATPEEVARARVLYMAGAQHLFASLMAALDADHDPTPKDLMRMSLIAAELQAFEPHLAALAAGPKTGTTQ